MPNNLTINPNFNIQSNLSPKMNQLLSEGISPQPTIKIKSNKNIPTSPVLQNIDSNLSSVENPLFPGQKLSVGALQEINQLKTPTSPVLQNIGSPNTSQFISQPEISNQEEQDNSRFLASLLGQGVAMFGAGIAGRDPIKAGEIISDQRAYQERLNQQQKIQKEQKDLADNLMNPESKQSLRKRLLYSRALGVDIPEDVSASDLEDPVVLNSLKQQSIQAQMAKMPKQLGVVQPKQEKEKKNPFQKEITEVNIKSKNTIDALDELEKLVSKYGTTEIFGPESNTMQQLIDSIATDYNKIKDPNSTVRGDEADRVRASLGLGGIAGALTSKSTALKQIQNFKNMVKRQRDTAISQYQNPNAIDINTSIDFSKEK